MEGWQTQSDGVVSLFSYPLTKSMFWEGLEWGSLKSFLLSWLTPNLPLDSTNYLLYSLLKKTARKNIILKKIKI